MSKQWQSGDLLTAADLNRLEEGIAFIEIDINALMISGIDSIGSINTAISNHQDWSYGGYWPASSGTFRLQPTYTNNSGTNSNIRPLNNAICTCVAVQEGDLFVISGQGGTDIRLWSWLEEMKHEDTNNNNNSDNPFPEYSAEIIDRAVQNLIKTPDEQYYIIAPPRAKYLLYQTYTTKNSSPVEYSLKKGIASSVILKAFQNRAQELGEIYNSNLLQLWDIETPVPMTSGAYMAGDTIPGGVTAGTPFCFYTIKNNLITITTRNDECINLDDIADNHPQVYIQLPIKASSYSRQNKLYTPLPNIFPDDEIYVDFKYKSLLTNSDNTSDSDTPQNLLLVIAQEGSSTTLIRTSEPGLHHFKAPSDGAALYVRLTTEKPSVSDRQIIPATYSIRIWKKSLHLEPIQDSEEDFMLICD